MDFNIHFYTVKSAGGLPTSLYLNSATELPNSKQFSDSSLLTWNYFIFRILKITKLCRNSISSITFDRELHFWHKNIRWKAYEILYNFIEDCICKFDSYNLLKFF